MPWWTYPLRDLDFSVQIYQLGTGINSSSPNKLVSTSISSAYYFSRTVLGSWTTFSFCIISDLYISLADWGSLSCSHSMAKLPWEQSVMLLAETTQQHLRVHAVCLSWSPKVSLLPLKHGGDLLGTHRCVTYNLWGVNIPCGQTLTNERRGSVANFFLYVLSGDPVASYYLSEDVLQIWAFSFKEVLASSVTYFLMFAFSSFLPHSCTAIT